MYVSTSMQRVVYCVFAGLCGLGPAVAQPLHQPIVQPMPVAPSYYAASGEGVVPVAQRGPDGPDLGGGFIEFLFRGPQPRYRQESLAPVMAPPVMQPHVLQPQPQPVPQPHYVHRDPRHMSEPPAMEMAPVRPAVDPRYVRQVVPYAGAEKPGTVIIDTPKRFLFLVEPGGKAVRYGIGVGRPGFTWAGVKSVTRKAEWPDWRPPAEMLKRRPDLPTFMAGGPNNPLGARALYLGSSLYRIHGSNEPWTIGQAVSSGCIRMRNEDVIDLYDRVKVGTRVIVI